MSGTLYGVGVGPGDPELITKKAERIIRACPVLAVPDAGRGERPPCTSWVSWRRARSC